MISLDAIETARRLPYNELVPMIGRAAQELANGDLHAPERTVVPLVSNASLLCMPAAAADIGITKVVTVHPDNRARHLPVIQGEVIVFDAGTGERLLLLDGPTVTARRTAAVTLLAIDRLAQRQTQSALLIGTGIQAAAHADALIEYLGVREFWIAGTTLQSATHFCDRLRAMHPRVHAAPIAASALEPAGLGTDIVIAATTARTPVIPAQLPDTTLAIGVGAFRPDMAEFPSELLARRRIVVDYLEGARHEAGDLLRAHVNWQEVSQLGDALDRPITDASPRSFAFKSVGHASWDLAAARVALRDQR